MLNPIVLLPWPLALFLLGLLTYAALRYLDAAPAYPTWPQNPNKPPRHRLAAVAEPYRPRPWDEVTGEITAVPAPVEDAYDPLDHRIPLAEVERRMGLFTTAWRDNTGAIAVRIPLPEIEQATRELEPVA